VLSPPDRPHNNTHAQQQRRPNYIPPLKVTPSRVWLHRSLGAVVGYVYRARHRCCVMGEAYYSKVPLLFVTDPPHTHIGEGTPSLCMQASGNYSLRRSKRP